MPDRAVATSRIQIGVEAVAAPGTPVAANKRLSAMSLDLSPSADLTPFGPTGELLDTVMVLNREWSEGDLSGQPTYTELVYALAGVLGDAAITTPGGATLAREWAWTLSGLKGIKPRTFTWERGDVEAGNAERAAYLLLTALNMSFSRTGGNEMGGSAIAQRMDFGARLTGDEIQTVTITGGPTAGTFTLTYSGQTTAGVAYNAAATAVQTALEALSNIGTGNVLVTGGPGPATPYSVRFIAALGQTDVAQMTAAHTFTGGTTPGIAVTTATPGGAPSSTALIPISPSEVSVYLDDSAAALGTTKLLRDFTVGFEIADLFNPVWPLNAAKPSFDGHVITKPNPTATLSVGNDAVGRQLVDVMRSGATKYMRVEGVGPLVEAGQSYLFRIDLAGKISDAPSMADADGVSTLDWTMRMVHDSVWNAGAKFLLRNSIASLTA